MEIIIIGVLFLAIFAIITTSDRPTQPSFMITPISDEHFNHTNNNGCLIMSILVITILILLVTSI